MIIILEIPHRMPPVCWTATNIEDACYRAGVEAEAYTEDALLEKLAGDNNSARIFNGPDDVQWYLAHADGHQAITAMQRVREMAEDIGWVARDTARA